MEYDLRSKGNINASDMTDLSFGENFLLLRYLILQEFTVDLF